MSWPLPHAEAISAEKISDIVTDDIMNQTGPESAAITFIPWALNNMK